MEKDVKDLKNFKFKSQQIKLNCTYSVLIYQDWFDYHDSVKGYTLEKQFNGFRSRQEAEKFVADNDFQESHPVFVISESYDMNSYLEYNNL